VHALVTSAAAHSDGSGLAHAGAIGRQLSIVHSRQRCRSQRRTRELRSVGCSSVSTKRYRLPNNPLMAFQRVRPAFGGPARATSTGTLARFKILRVKSPMM